MNHILVCIHDREVVRLCYTTWWYLCTQPWEWLNKVIHCQLLPGAAGIMEQFFSWHKVTECKMALQYSTIKNVLPLMGRFPCLFIFRIGEIWLLVFMACKIRYLSGLRPIHFESMPIVLQILKSGSHQGLVRFTEDRTLQNHACIHYFANESLGTPGTPRNYVRCHHNLASAHLPGIVFQELNHTMYISVLYNHIAIITTTTTAIPHSYYHHFRSEPTP